MRNRRLKISALFPGSFFLLLFFLSLTAFNLVPASGPRRNEPGPPKAESEPAAFGNRKTPRQKQHSRMYGKAGQHDTFHLETDLFAGANKAGVPAASQALASEAKIVRSLE